MKPLKEWVAQILAIKPDRTLDEIYRAIHGFYSKEQILTVWTPEDECPCEEASKSNCEICQDLIPAEEMDEEAEE